MDATNYLITVQCSMARLAERHTWVAIAEGIKAFDGGAPVNPNDLVKFVTPAKKGQRPRGWSVYKVQRFASFLQAVKAGDIKLVPRPKFAAGPRVVDASVRAQLLTAAALASPKRPRKAKPTKRQRAAA